MLSTLAASVTVPTAHAEIRADLNEIKDGKTVPLPSWKIRHEWKWNTIESETSVLQSIITITPSEPIQITQVQMRGARWLKEEKDRKKSVTTVRMQMSTLDEEVTLKFDAGKTKSLGVSLKASASEIVTQGCEPFGVELVRGVPLEPGKRPFYLGMSCKTGKAGSFVTITVPKDVTWGSTSIFETAGKGEQWRQYALGKITAGEKGVIGKLNFIYNGTAHSYSLVDKKALAALDLQADTQTPEDRWMQLRLGGGPGRIAVSTPRISDSLFDLGLSLDVETRKFLRYIKAEALLDLALPIQTGSVGADFFDAQLSLKPEFKIGAFTLSPGIYFISQLGHYNSGTLSYEFNQPGIGLEVRWLRSRGSNLTLTVASSGTLPSASNKFLSMGLGYQFAQGTALGHFGIDLQFRQVSLADPSGGTDSMNESMLNWVWHY